jgi:hypothetical protein
MIAALPAGLAGALTPSVLGSSTPSSVVISNVGYLAGLVVLAAILVTIVVLRHRRPVSTEANLDSFHRGLAALAPDKVPGRHRQPQIPHAPLPSSQLRVQRAPVRADGGPPPEPSARSEPG